VLFQLALQIEEVRFGVDLEAKLVGRIALVPPAGAVLAPQVLKGIGISTCIAGDDTPPARSWAMAKCGTLALR
jgi:hypothetical protein